MSINLAICDKLEAEGCFTFNFFGEKKKTINESIELIYDDLLVLLRSEEFNNAYLFNYILNKTIQLIGAEYGMIVINDEETGSLRVKAMTNIAWNAVTEDLYHRFFFKKEALAFPIKDNLFEKMVQTSLPVIINNYLKIKTNDRLPKGHPFIKRTILIPIIQAGKVKYAICMCNKINPFTKKDARTIERIGGILLLLRD